MAAPDLFSAPRRFDLFTILVAAAAYAVLFTGLRLLGAPPLVLGIIGGLFAVVAIGQGLTHGRMSPRRASIYAAMLFWTAFLVLMTVRAAIDFGPAPMAGVLISGLFGVVVYGLITGYFVGVLVGGVFLVSYHLRTWFARSASGEESDAAPQDSSPWDETA